MLIKAVLFDLDNTLTHRDQSVQAYSQHFIDSFGTSLASTQQRDVEKTIEVIRRIDNGGYPKKEFLSHPSIAASVGQALLNELAWNKRPQLDTLTAFWFEEFGLSAIAMLGAERLLQQLKQEHYKLAVISNGGHATRLKILEGLGFIDCFDEVFSSESVGISKPKAEIFLHSCRQIHAQPQQSVYIGDHPVNDYQGATEAGLNALLLDGFHPHSVTDPVRQNIPDHAVIQHLDDVALFLNHPIDAG